jgi:hypothetical protein
LASSSEIARFLEEPLVACGSSFFLFMVSINWCEQWKGFVCVEFEGLKKDHVTMKMSAKQNTDFFPPRLHTKLPAATNYSAEKTFLINTHHKQPLSLDRYFVRG